MAPGPPAWMGVLIVSCVSIVVSADREPVDGMAGPIAAIAAQIKAINDKEERLFANLEAMSHGRAEASMRSVVRSELRKQDPLDNPDGIQQEALSMLRSMFRKDSGASNGRDSRPPSDKSSAVGSRASRQRSLRAASMMRFARVGDEPGRVEVEMASAKFDRRPTVQEFPEKPELLYQDPSKSLTKLFRPVSHELSQEAIKKVVPFIRPDGDPEALSEQLAPSDPNADAIAQATQAALAQKAAEASAEAKLNPQILPMREPAPDLGAQDALLKKEAEAAQLQRELAHAVVTAECPDPDLPPLKPGDDKQKVDPGINALADMHAQKRAKALENLDIADSKRQISFQYARMQAAKACMKQAKRGDAKVDKVLAQSKQVANAITSGPARTAGVNLAVEARLDALQKIAA